MAIPSPIIYLYLYQAIYRRSHLRLCQFDHCLHKIIAGQARLERASVPYIALALAMNWIISISSPFEQFVEHVIVTSAGA